MVQSQHACHARSALTKITASRHFRQTSPAVSLASNMPSQEYGAQEDIALSPTESVNVNKRKAPDSNSGEEEEVLCPCGAGPCALLTSNKPVSQGRKFYRCPKPKDEGQCGFFQWQDQPPSRKQPNHGSAQPSMGSHSYVNNEPAPSDHTAAVQCRCGLEAVEITSNSAANPGRVFYKCPKAEGEGKCRFFKWQDELDSNQQPLQQQSQPAVPVAAPHGNDRPASTPQGIPTAAAGGSGVFADEDGDFGDNFGFGDAANAGAGVDLAAHNSNAPPPFHHDPQQRFDGQATSPGAVQPPEVLNCSCGLQCSYIMAKTVKNDGRWFYRCPKPKEEGQCRFFQWADELGQQAPPSAGRSGEYAPPARPPAPAAPTYHTYSSPNKIGAVSAASSDACYKCGQSGHWSRDCPNGGGGGAGGGGGGGGSGGGACFKCGQEGHWSRDCPNPGSGGGRGGGGGRGYGGRTSQGYGGSYGGRGMGSGAGAGAAQSGACYKCGQSGHWTNSCPN